jgi:hypothetical protein
MILIKEVPPGDRTARALLLLENALEREYKQVWPQPLLRGGESLCAK